MSVTLLMGAMIAPEPRHRPMNRAWHHNIAYTVVDAAPLSAVQIVVVIGNAG